MSQALNDYAMLETGQTGALIINDTSAHVGSWRKMTVLVTAAATVILDGVTSASMTIPAGVDLRGRITSVTLGSGTVVVYK